MIVILKFKETTRRLLQQSGKRQEIANNNDCRDFQRLEKKKKQKKQRIGNYCVVVNFSHVDLWYLNGEVLQASGNIGLFMAKKDRYKKNVRKDFKATVYRE